ncbi:MAG: AraC family transcriptional regulator [Ktedonobacteraceae bacterium]|nr:AraC family transcriptional regulator [Ktedonobacteraceae bacterium]
MIILSEERPSDSPYVEIVMHGHTVLDGSTIRPAETCWHMVIRKLNGKTDFLVVGPWTSAGVISYTEGAELLWIKFKLGTFLPTKHLLDTETILPASKRSFRLDGSTWQFPDYENADTFVNRLARAGVLAYDPIVNALLQNHQDPQNHQEEIPSRTLRHHFKRSTGLSASHIRQIKRAQHAQTLLQQGASILDTVDEAGYFDQPHLTRSLKQFIGYTPAQIIRSRQPELAIRYNTTSPSLR